MAVPCRKGLAVSQIIKSPLVAGAVGLPAALAGVPWWVALTAALLVGLAVPLSSEMRAWLRIRDQRQVQRAALLAIGRIAEPKDQVQALMQLHQAAGGSASLTPSSETGSPPSQPPGAT